MLTVFRRHAKHLGDDDGWQREGKIFQHLHAPVRLHFIEQFINYLLHTRAQRINQALMAVERRLTRPDGLVSRPWFKSLQFAADLDNGYATMAFPSVNEAIRYADAQTANKELVDLVNRVDQARAALVEAAAALR